MSTVEDPETVSGESLADLLPTGSVEPEVAEADPLDLSVPTEQAPAEPESPSGAAPETSTDEDSRPTPRPDSPYDRPGRWFVVHTQSGYENKVSQNLAARTASMNLEERILEVVIPMEDVVEFRNGKKVNVSKKMFPGYLLVRCHLDATSWSAIRDTPGIVNFVGAGGKPSPLSRREVENFLQAPDEAAPEQAKKSRARLGFDVGETVRVKEGPFADFSGAIIEINEDQLKVKVLVNIFGRETPVELEFSQIAQL